MGKRFSEMNQAEFDDLVAGYIDRMATGHGEMPAETFLDLLTERIETKLGKVNNPSIDVVDDSLSIIQDQETGELT